MIKFLCPIVAALLTACGPSCAERGGELVKTGEYFNPVFTGNNQFILVPMDIYSCNLPSEDSAK